MPTFTTVREAKEFLVSCIVTEAQRENVPITEVERKMLYFSETHWTLPEMDSVNSEFDRDYDSAMYEDKIGNLIGDFCLETRKSDPHQFALWKEAVHVLSKEDHYLQVLIGVSNGSITRGGKTSSVAAIARLLRLILIGFVVFLALYAISLIYILLKR